MKKFVHQKITVPFDYPVVFCRRLFDPANPLLVRVLDRKHEQRRHRVLVFVDSGLVRAVPGLPHQIQRYFGKWRAQAELVAPPQILAGGERSKQGLNVVKRLIGVMARHHLDRQSYVIGVGGGAVLDTTGLAAALVHRGLRMIRVPTTVVAQNDVAVGVKTGVDAFGAKNFIGVFAPPFAVLNDFDFLPFLDDREWRGGIAEAFKVAIIKDRTFFGFLCRNAERLRARDRRVMETVVRRCAILHLDHIREGGDPFEFGSARPLDFGHWSAHQLETASHYRLRHGQAVSIGIALDTCYAARIGLLRDVESQGILQALLRSGLPIWHPLLDARDRRGGRGVFQGLERFREHLGGVLTITLPNGIGARREVHSMDRRILALALTDLKGIHQRAMR